MCVLDLHTKSWSTIDGSAVPARAGHSMAKIDTHAHMFIFGGQGKLGNLLNDVAMYDVTHGHWYAVEVSSSRQPLPLEGHTSVAIGTCKVHPSHCEVVLSKMWLVIDSDIWWAP